MQTRNSNDPKKKMKFDKWFWNINRQQIGNRNAGPARRSGGQVGGRNNNPKFGGPIKGGIRKRNAGDRAKKVLAKNAASKDPDTTADSNDKPKER